MTPADLAELLKITAAAVLADHDLDAAVLPETVTVERPRNRDHGDYATNLALQVGKKVGTNPRELAGWLADALAAQARRLLTPSPAFYNEQSLKLAKALVDSSCFDQVFFANSGAEANEGAIKLARKWGQLHKGGAYRMVTAVNSFHGRTLGTIAALLVYGLWETAVKASQMFAG